MEQSHGLFEFRMNGVPFVFESPSINAAERFREIALVHFGEILGEAYIPELMQGPFPRSLSA
jgi:hypothetical protein